MDFCRKTAIIVGALFITATATSILGGSLIASNIDSSDDLFNVFENQNQIILGVLFVLIDAIAVIFIAILMYPILKKYNEGLALGYVGFRGALKTFIFLTLVIGWFSLHQISQA